MMQQSEMNVIRPKVRKNFRIQSKENIDSKSNIATEPNGHQEEEEVNTSYESQGVNKNLRRLRQGMIKPNRIPKINHVIFDTMKIEAEYIDDFQQYEMKDNLDEWYQHTKSKLADYKDATNLVNYDDIKNKNQQRMLLDTGKEKYRSPNLDQNILNAILHTGQNKGNGDKQQENTLKNNRQGDRNSFSHISQFNNQEIQDGEKPQRNSVSSNFQNQRQLKKESKGLVFNVNAANTQGNICTSLTLLQQYNPSKEYLNPELVKKNNVQKIVNDIISDKMKKIMNNPKQYFQKMQGMNSTTDISSTVQDQTLKNFKNLRKYFSFGQKIDFGSLLQNLITNKQLPHKLFNFTEDEINPASSFKDVESELLNRYMNIDKAIKDKKQQQRVFRIEVAKWVQSLNDNQNDLALVQAKFDDLISQYSNIDKQIKRASAMQKSNVSRQKGQQRSRQMIVVNENMMSELDKLNKESKNLQDDQQTQIEKKQELEMIIKSLNSDIQVLISHIDQCDKDVENLKISRLNLKTYLRDNYTKILKKDLTSLPSAQKENLSLVWAVKSMNILHEAVERSQFPQFIDEQSFQFLKQAAVIEQEIDMLKQQIKNFDFSKIDLSQQKKDKYEKVIVNLNKSNTKQEIQKKLKSITSDCLQVKKPIFQISQDSKKHEIQWVCDNLNPYSPNHLNKNGVDEEDLQQAVQERQRIVDQIQLRQSQYLKLKDQELMRLIQQNEKREDKNLFKKFIILFGTIDGAADHHNYTHLTQCFLKKVSESKNFSFMGNNRQQMIINNNNSLRSSERLSMASSSNNDLKTEADSVSIASSKHTSNRYNQLITCQSMTSLTDKYINTIKGPQLKLQYNSNNIHLGSNLNLDAFDTFMGSKLKQQTPKMTRISTAQNNFANETRSTITKPYSTSSLRNLSINI